MIKIAICDDEKYFVDTVEKMLKIYAEKNGKDFCIKKYTKPLQLMESLKEEFQIFFLDIEMPAMDGMVPADLPLLSHGHLKTYRQLQYMQLIQFVRFYIFS